MVFLAISTFKSMKTATSSMAARKGSGFIDEPSIYTVLDFLARFVTACGMWPAKPRCLVPHGARWPKLLPIGLREATEAPRTGRTPRGDPPGCSEAAKPSTIWQTFDLHPSVQGFALEQGPLGATQKHTTLIIIIMKKSIKYIKISQFLVGYPCLSDIETQTWSKSTANPGCPGDASGSEWISGVPSSFPERLGTHWDPRQVLPGCARTIRPNSKIQDLRAVANSWACAAADDYGWRNGMFRNPKKIERSWKHSFAIMYNLYTYNKNIISILVGFFYRFYPSGAC